MKKIIVLLVTVLFAFTLTSCGEKMEYTDIDNEGLQELLENKSEYQFIDVRTYQEYQEKRITGFNYLMDVYVLDGDISALDQLDKSKPIVLMCNSGNRSVDAAQIFWDAGFTEIYNLEDGIQGWMSDDLPIIGTDIN